MLRKIFITILLVGQILLFSVAAGNQAKADDVGPLPPCAPCPK